MNLASRLQLYLNFLMYTSSTTPGQFWLVKHSESENWHRKLHAKLDVMVNFTSTFWCQSFKYVVKYIHLFYEISHSSVQFQSSYVHNRVNYDEFDKSTSTLPQLFDVFPGPAGQMALRRPPSGGPFWLFPGPAGQMALRRLLEVHFDHFRDPPAKWLSGGLWRSILTISGARRPNGSQEAPGGSFWAFLGPAGQMALRRSPEASKMSYFIVFLFVVFSRVFSSKLRKRVNLLGQTPGRRVHLAPLSCFTVFSGGVFSRVFSSKWANV